MVEVVLRVFPPHCQYKCTMLLSYVESVFLAFFSEVQANITLLMLVCRLLRNKDDDRRNPEGRVIFQDATVWPEAMDCDWHLYLGGNLLYPRFHVLLVHISEEAEEVF